MGYVLRGGFRGILVRRCVVNLGVGLGFLFHGAKSLLNEVEADFLYDFLLLISVLIPQRIFSGQKLMSPNVVLKIFEFFL